MVDQIILKCVVIYPKVYDCQLNLKSTIILITSIYFF